MNTGSQRVLITGASSGIGFALAQEFAQHGHPLVISSMQEGDLAQVTQELIATYGVDVRSIGLDLTHPDAPQQLFDALKSENLEIEILANNAGVGSKGRFVGQSLSEQLKMIRLNVEAVVSLTRLFLPEMLQRGHGRILNTASIAGFMPAPDMAVYHATKAFIVSLSEALAVELQDTGVTLTALCPGATDTDFFERAGAVETTMFQKGNVMAPQVVAEGAYRALFRGDRIFIPGGINKAMVFSRRLMPDSILARLTQIFYSDVKPEDHQREPGDIAAHAAPHQ